jgi:hypothetical protein
MISVFNNGSPHNVTFRHGITLRDALQEAGVQLDGPYSFGVNGQTVTDLGRILNDGESVSAIAQKMSGAAIGQNGLPQSFPVEYGVYVDCVQKYNTDRNEPMFTERGRAVTTEPQWLVKPSQTFAANLGDAIAQARVAFLELPQGDKEGERPKLDPDTARDIVVFARNLLTNEVMFQNP